MQQWFFSCWFPVMYRRHHKTHNAGVKLCSRPPAAYDVCTSGNRHIDQPVIFWQKPLRTEAFTQSRCCTQGSLTQRSLHIHAGAFADRSLVHREVFTRWRFYTGKSLHKWDLHTETFTHRRVYTPKVLQVDAFTAHRNFVTEPPLHIEVFTQRGFLHIYTAKFLGTEAFA